MYKEWDAVNLLRHSRHDWLNQIQLIKGNLALNHIDRVHEIIDNIILQSRHESKLSNLGIPNLAGHFLTFNWEQHTFYLEIEVIGEVYDLSPFEEPLIDWWSNFYKVLDSSCQTGADNHLIVTFQMLEDNIFVTFDFHGHLLLSPESQAFFKSNKIAHEQIEIVESYLNEEELVLTVKLI